MASNSKDYKRLLENYFIQGGCEYSVDWNSYRLQASLFAMHAIAESLGSIDYNKELIAKHAVELADALIAELKGGEE